MLCCNQCFVAVKLFCGQNDVAVARNWTFFLFFKHVLLFLVKEHHPLLIIVSTWNLLRAVLHGIAPIFVVWNVQIVLAHFCGELLFSSAAEHLAELRLRRSLSSLGLDLVHMWTPDREHPRTRETGDLSQSTFVTLDVCGWVSGVMVGQKL